MSYGFEVIAIYIFIRCGQIRQKEFEIKNK